MIAVVIPSHNQGHHIKKIIRGYERQTLIPDLLLFVFDRCNDNSENIIKTIKTDLNVRYITKLSGENFSAGMTRDYGVTYIETYFPEYKTIIFTDGDCVPDETVVSSHFTNCNQDFPIVSCGYRISETKDNNWDVDKRFLYCDMCNDNKLGRIVLTKKYTIESILTYSCNFAFNRKAIEICKSINYLLSNKNRVFNPEFDGSWGGEDNFISNCIYRAGGYILLTNKNCVCYHFYHEESSNDNKVEIVRKLDRRLVSEILNKNLSFDYLEIEPINNIRYPYLQSFNNIHKIIKTENCVEKIISKIPSDIIDMDIITLKNYMRYILSRVNIISQTKNKNNTVYEYDDTYVYQLTDILNNSKFYLRNNEIEFEPSEKVNLYSKVLNFDDILATNK